MFTGHNHASVLFNRLATSLATLYPLWLMYWCLMNVLEKRLKKSGSILVLRVCIEDLN